MKKILAFFGAMFILSGLAFAVEDVGIMDLSFCGGQNHYVVTLATGENTHAICMHIKNKWFQTSSIALTLVDGEFSHGDRPVQACKTNGNGFFGQSTTISGDAVVTLAPWQETDRYLHFTKLTGYVGILHGCIAYSVVDPDKVASNAPMSVLTRKANLIDITVPGKVTSNFFLIPLTGVAGNATKVFTSYGKELAWDEKIKIFYRRKDKVLSTFMGIENSGFVDEEYKKVLQFSSFFGLVKRKDESNIAQLYAQTTTLADVINYVPRYHLFIKVKVSVVHRPVAITPDTPQEERQSIDSNFAFFLIPWYYILIGAGVLAVLIWLLIMLFKRFGKRRARRRLERQEWLEFMKEKATKTSPSKKTTSPKPSSTKTTVKKTTTAKKKTVAKKKPKA